MILNYIGPEPILIRGQMVKVFKRQMPVLETRGLNPLLKRMCGFTLCEVLITLGILGVIAEITIPDLYNNMKEQQTVGMLKKEYSVLSQAFTLAVQENGTPDNWTSNSAQTGLAAIDYMNKIAPYIKITKSCGATSGCLPAKYKNLNIADGVDLNAYGSIASVELSDGTLLTTFVRDTNCTYSQVGGSLTLNNICAEFGVDINGFKQPNTFGKDFFRFWISKYGIVPKGDSNTLSSSLDYFKFSTGCLGLNGEACAAWVLYNENMDYLHCSNLSWNGPTKCQ